MEVFTTSGTYPWSFVSQIFHNGQPSHGGDRKIIEVMTSTLPKGTLGYDHIRFWLFALGHLILLFPNFKLIGFLIFRF